MYFPIFNYNQGSLDAVRQMLTHPRALFGLGDAGAHVGTICDASFSTFMLSHWVLGRGHDRLSLSLAVAREGQVTAARPGRLVRLGH